MPFMVSFMYYNSIILHVYRVKASAVEVKISIMLENCDGMNVCTSV